MRRAILVMIAILAAGCGSDDPKTDRGIQAAADLGIPKSPTADLLGDLTKGQAPTGPRDPVQDERNARMLPQVMKDSNDAIAKIQNGADPLDTVKEWQKKMPPSPATR